MKCSFSQPSPVRGTQLVGNNVARITPAIAAALRTPNSLAFESVMTSFYYEVARPGVAVLHHRESLRGRQVRVAEQFASDSRVLWAHLAWSRCLSRILGPLASSFG